MMLLYQVYAFPKRKNIISRKTGIQDSKYDICHMKKSTVGAIIWNYRDIRKINHPKDVGVMSDEKQEETHEEVAMNEIPKERDYFRKPLTESERDQIKYLVRFLIVAVIGVIVAATIMGIVVTQLS